MERRVDWLSGPGREKSRIRIVLGSASLAGYPEGGGHWTWFLQYLFGLRALGHDVFWLEVFRSSGDHTQDGRLLRIFFSRVKRYGFGDRCALLLYDRERGMPDVAAARAYGLSRQRTIEVARSADVLWNLGCGLRQPLLSLFRHRVLVDVDPGHLQVSALTWDLGIQDHQVFLTVGSKLRAADSAVPTLGVTWRAFRPFVYLPMWRVVPDPGSQAPFSSVTQWTWEALQLGDRPLSISKRDGYLRYVALPRRTRRPFELAANIHPADDTGDRDLLLSHGWRLAHPHDVAGSPAVYRRYIRRSRAEFLCPKPIHRELGTGWFSDRSACYLATGRPVLMEDTGLGDYVPTGQGLLVFRDLEEAVEKVAEIDSDYARHARAARVVAEEVLDSKRCLEAMLAAS